MPTGDLIEILHLGASAIAIGVALYVGKQMAQLKLAILENVRREYVSKEMMETFDQRMSERHEYNKATLEELKKGYDLIHRRLDEFFHARRGIDKTGI